MTLLKATAPATRFSADAGIAIGPILFIIAILGILATAIAAGSGSFTAGSSSEENRTKAGAMLEIGQNLKLGHDRMTSNGTLFADIIVNPTETEDAVDLFAPSGGGITAPSASLGTGSWGYFADAWEDMGTTADERIAILQVTSGVCERINFLASGVANVTTNATAAFGATPAISTVGAVTGLTVPANLPSALEGKSTGCFINSDPDPDTHYFFQILGVQ